MKYNRFMGEYDPNTEYEKLDVVTFDGDAYYRTKAGKGVSPIGKTVFKTWSKLSQTLAEALNLGGGGSSIPSGGVSYTEGYRISASSGEVSANAATDLTDFIAVSTGDKVELYSMTMPADTANVGVHFYAEDKTTKLLSMVGVGAFPHGDWTYTMQGNNVTMFVVPEWPELDGVAYMRIVANEITDKSAIVVSHNQQESTGLPSGGEPYMQLVTDGEGKAGWEQRLAWKEVVVDFEWDGDKNNPIYDSESESYLITNSVTSPEQLNGATYILHSAGMDLDSEPTVLDASIFAKVENIPAYSGTVEALIPEASLNVTCGLMVLYEDLEMGGMALKAGLYGGTMNSGAFISMMNKETIHPIPAEYLPSPTVYYANANYGYLYHDAEYTTKVSMEELEAAMQGDVWVAYDTDSVFGYNSRVIKWNARRDDGYYNVKIMDDDAGSPVFRTFYTSEHAAVPS